jgi:hypothetical protein
LRFFSDGTMGRKRGPNRVALSFRCEPERMRDIQEAALLLGTDANGVLNELVSAGLPALLDRAQKRHQALLDARSAKDYDLTEIGDLLLRRLLLVGRVAGPGERQEVMRIEAKREYKAKYPTPDQLAARAGAIDDVLWRLHQLRLMIHNQQGWVLNDAERAQLEKTAERLHGELERQLADWQEFVFPNEPAGGGAAQKSSKRTAPRE